MSLILGMGLALVASASSSLSWGAEKIEGQIFTMGSDRKELLFNFSNTTDVATDVQKSESQFVDLKGEVAVIEKSERKGAQLKRYDMDHRQTGRKGSIVVEGNQVVFHLEENGKAKKVQTEKLADNFIVGHTLVPYLSQRWTEVMSGKKIDIRFGVWDRQETVGFSLFKEGQEKLNGQDVVLLKFKPTSFVIAALVDPVIFKFSPDGKRLMGLVGRVPPKQKQGNKWKDLDAEVIYQYDVQAAAVSAL